VDKSFQVLRVGIVVACTRRVIFIKYKGGKRRPFSEIYNYGALSYVVQTDLKSGNGKYRIFRLDSHTGDVRIVCEGISLKQARKLMPTNEKLAPHTII